MNDFNFLTWFNILSLNLSKKIFDLSFNCECFCFKMSFKFAWKHRFIGKSGITNQAFSDVSGPTKQLSWQPPH